MHIDVLKIGAEEMKLFSNLINLFDNVFELNNRTVASDDHLKNLLQDHNFLCFVANVEGELAGGLTAYVLTQYHSERPVVYLYDLAVHPRFQRKGVGSQLMKALNSFCTEIGAEEFFVQADDIDSHAIQFYRATGGTAEKVTHFTY